MHVLRNAIYYGIGIFFSIQSNFAQRRIHNGESVKTDHPYAVYLLKAPPSETKYLGWTCGGAIVTPEYIITSAACVEDVKYMYAIAGYKNFVDASKLQNDKCANKYKKKVVLTCVPKDYELEYDKIEKWAVSDIAVVQVESPFNFEDEGWKTICSYTPQNIEINYEDNAQTPGLDAIVLGWGHRQKWRDMGDNKSYNTPSLDYASVKIINKKKCKEHFKSTNSEANEKFHKIIDKYMICTLGKGMLDEIGDPIKKSKSENDGCDEDDPENKETITTTTTKDSSINDFEKITTTTKARKKRTNIVSEEEEEEEYEEEEEDYAEADARKSGIRTFGQRNHSNAMLQERRNFTKRNGMFQKLGISTRRNGICQNDHGGPLINWVGGHKFLIGVASAFMLKDHKCVGPYLFTSTKCNSAFIKCIIAPPEEKNEEFRRNCDAPPEVKGFDMIERRISWVEHPAGPAENEMYQMRPQIPISQYYK